MKCNVTKTTAIQFIDGNSHNIIKKQKSHKTTLSDYYVCLSHNLLLINTLGGGDTHTNTPTFADGTI